MDWQLLLVTFGLIFPVELPDKTFIAALVLSTRYPPLAVWLGVGLAFGVQCLVAVSAGHAVSFLPEWIIHTLSTVSGSPVSVFVGSWAALLTVSGLAVVGGRVLLRYMRLSLLHYIAAGVCLLFAGVGIYSQVTA